MKEDDPRRAILTLIEECRKAERNGISLSEIRHQLLPEKIQPFLRNASAFLNWVREDPEFSYFYFDVQQSGACAKPAEAAAMMIEAIVFDALEN